MRIRVGPAPWGPDGRTSTFDICPCCGVEWGYGDSRCSSRLKYRAEWLEAGGRWIFDDVPHDGLTTEERLSHVSADFA
jgi:hypothetical protein